MKKQRNAAKRVRSYTAYCFDGHEYFYVDFESDCRANSKGNEKDLRDTYKRRYGFNDMRRGFRVLNVSRKVD